MDVQLLFLMSVVLHCSNGYTFNRKDVESLQEKLDEVEDELAKTIEDFKSKGGEEDKNKNGKGGEEDKNKGKGEGSNSLWAWNAEHATNVEVIGGDMRTRERTGSDIPDGVKFDLLEEKAYHWDYYTQGDDGRQYLEIPYVYGKSANSNVTSAFQLGIDDYTANTCIRFIERTNQEYYLKIVNKDGCWSWVGRQELQYQPQEVSLQHPGCTSKATASHEMMHALGYEHEQSRPDRNDYVKINYENMRDGVKGNFDKMKTITQGTRYDYKSVMHYDAYAFTKNGFPTIERIDDHADPHDLGNEEGLSKIDIESLNLKYCGGNWPTPEPEVTPTEEPWPTTTPTEEPWPTDEPEHNITTTVEPAQECHEMDPDLCKFIKGKRNKAHPLCQDCNINRACPVECEDRDHPEDCEFYARCYDDCQIDVKYMSKFCAGTCRKSFCGEHEAWEDKEGLCDDFEWKKKRETRNEKRETELREDEI